MLKLRHKIITLVVLVVPLLIIFFADKLINLTRPDTGRVVPVEALRDGFIYFNCDKPFIDALSLNEKSSVEAKCNLVEGEKQLAVKMQPGRKTKAKYVLPLKFSQSYNERFQGKTIRVSVEARCVSCDGPVLMRYATQTNGRSDTHELTFESSLSWREFEYAQPVLNSAMFEKGPLIAIDISKIGPEATFFVKKLTVTAKHK